MDKKGSHQLRLLFKTFNKHTLESLGLNVFALADAAQDQKFLKSFIHLRQQCLLVEAAGEKARAVSPHLLQLPVDFLAKEWKWLGNHVAGTPHMTIIISSLPFDSLFNHLRNFLEVQLEGGLDLFLAFWDPNILATLVGHDNQTLYVKGPVLSEQQLKSLLMPIQSWWYWDRTGNIQVIWGENQYGDLTPVETPLYFSEEQERLLIESTMPDHLVYYLKLNNAFLIDGINDLELYEFVVERLSKAQEYGLSGTRDLLNFICLKLLYQEKFDTDEKLQSLLSDLKNKDISMDDIMLKLAKG